MQIFVCFFEKNNSSLLTVAVAYILSEASCVGHFAQGYVETGVPADIQPDGFGFL
jgi:hypothetical protein